MRTIILCLASGLVSLSAIAQSRLTENTLSLDHPSNMPHATVGDLSWMAGHWGGAFLGGTANEIWTLPAGGSMMGMFKLIQDEDVAIYEFMTLVNENESVVLKLKHFNGDLTGWEEKDDHVAFPLVRLGDREAYFEGLTFRRTSADTLRGYLAMKTADGVNEVAFTYRLVE